MTYRSLCVQPHHANNLRPVIGRKSRLSKAIDTVEGERDVIDGDTSSHIDHGQIGASFVPTKMSESMPAVGFSDWHQGSLIAEHPLAI